MGERWNPWATLRARAAARLLWGALPAATGGSVAMVSAGGLEVVVLDPRLGRVERRVALAHELVHLERGVLHASAPVELRDVEEARVRAETARRLVPVVELRSWAASRAEVEPVTVVDVAQEFDVTHQVAYEACRLAA